MRLRKIRLAGFKSFVDATTIDLPGDLIGVVGPNGCGKSNIIDAVRWVMGEISAKHLRGDTMADVVFTGSNTRKPVGVASVELVFDNTDGRLGGRFAGYAEISVKRQVSRDSQSAYFINGTRCRRRDVMDVFLGTGLGPRSYAIIEQGMISRLIEARPEELREFLEEAAGISKYKERRRETENRIRHTQENLDRLTDIREELQRRLQHLKRQATMAEKYKLYKAEERELRAQLLALRWRALDAEAQRHAAAVAEQQNALEARIAEQRRTEAGLEAQRSGHTAAAERFNECYRQVLDAGAEMARTEEGIQALRARQDELAGSLAREEHNLAAAREHLREEEERRDALRDELERSEPELAGRQRSAGEARLAFRQGEEAMQAWQAEWEALTERAAEPAQIAHGERARVQHLEQNCIELERRLLQLQTDAAAFDTDALGAEVERLEDAAAAREAELESAGARLEDRQREVREQRDAGHALAERMHEERGRLQELGGRLASLQALQREALGHGDAPVIEWLRSHALDDRVRLAQALRVAPGWEAAIEVVLGTRLEAVCVDDLGALARDAAALEDGSLTLVGGGAGSGGVAPAGRWLGELVSGVDGVGGLLHGVIAVDGLEEALALRASLPAGHSVVTRDGTWLGPSWLRVARGAGESGVLARERELHALGDEQRRAEAGVASLREALESAAARLRAAEDAQAEAQDGVAEVHRLAGAARSELDVARARLEQATARVAEVRAEMADATSRLEAERRLLGGARERLERSSAELAQISGEREAWSRRREEQRERLEDARERWTATREEAYEIGLRVEAMRAQMESLGKSTARAHDQIAALQERCRELGETREGLREPLAEAESRLAGQLERRSELDRALDAARHEVEAAEERVRELDARRAEDEARVAEQRDLLGALRVQGQEVTVRRKTVEEQLAEDGQRLAEVVEALPAEAAEDEWVEKLQGLERRITRLGPINLAAIDEYEQQSERKTYLDAQHADLDEALATLQSAIQKIDRETRNRFRDTYERVNAGLGAMFPRLFGGGQASLELTGEDLLDTGISVMARPPGKRNTSIHLLSGGEKALTAVALVFAIFELNPAPFCLLDEVDAPLDDVNVVRFCELVKDMSERVQFLVVTHNKITMEITHQLIGVTMNEPGVSRLVAVDLDEAVEMATV